MESVLAAFVTWRRQRMRSLFFSADSPPRVLHSSQLQVLDEFGTVPTTMLSLWSAISGGNDPSDANLCVYFAVVSVSLS